LTRPRPVVLVILDGWGISDTKPSAVTEARLPNYRKLISERPFTTLEASGESVGLMPGQMGDSNVGHLNIGAGHIVYQDLVRIFRDIRNGSFFKNPALAGAMANARERSSRLHLMGLLSDGGVHSHQEHLYALLKMAKEHGVNHVLIHAFLDGRDVPPTSASMYLEALEKKISELGIGTLVSMTGRYYAMDRDRRWDRTEKAYRMLVLGEGRKAENFRAGLHMAYEKGETDEFVSPTIFTGSSGAVTGQSFPEKALGEFGEPAVKPGDSVIFFNFRADRARQITHALTDEDFASFSRGPKPEIYFCGMVRYEDDLSGHYAYTPLLLKNTLGEVVSKAGLRQLRIAETEKYAHVTFFFSGKREEPFTGEDRCLIPSPKVATYDLKPEMSAPEVTAEAIRRVKSGLYDFIVLNYANPDMVGHTGSFGASLKALETVDECLGRLLLAILEETGCALIIADHGNIEEVTPLERSSEAGHTYHSVNPVPCILVASGMNVRLRQGILSDVAPTILDLMGLEKPPEMDRQSLLIKL